MEVVWWVVGKGWLRVGSVWYQFCGIVLMWCIEKASEAYFVSPVDLESQTN